MTWLMTWTTYGTWLPGDARGFVSGLRETGDRVVHNQSDTPYDADRPGLRTYARSILREEPAWLTAEQGVEVAAQFRETAGYRGWVLHAVAVMANHVHLVAEAAEETHPSRLMTDFKAYATRRLNRASGRRTWWAERGSTRPLRTAAAVAAAVRYVADQHAPPLARANSRLTPAARRAVYNTSHPDAPEALACHSEPSR